ncbi:hypothetical protein TNCV_2941101 [Trichonephila clavipes]|nr:hypothetical protein TNCV_2941101 [Trichonephila clavipes]
MNNTDKYFRPLCTLNSTKNVNAQLERNNTNKINVTKLIIDENNIEEASKLDSDPDPFFVVIDDTDMFQNIPPMSFISNLSEENNDNNNIFDVIGEILNITYTELQSNIEYSTGSQGSNTNSSIFPNISGTETTTQILQIQNSTFQNLRTTTPKKIINDIKEERFLPSYLNSSIGTYYTTNSLLASTKDVALKALSGDTQDDFHLKS